MLLESIKSLFMGASHTTKKVDVQKVTSFIFTSISDSVIPTLDNLIANVDLPKLKNNQLLKNLGRLCGAGSSSKDVLANLRLMFITFSNNQSVIERLVNKDLNDVITDRAVTARDGAIMRVVSDIGSMTMFIMDFMDLVLLDESDSEYPNIKFKTIKSGMDTFGELYKAYGKSKEFEKLIKDIPSAPDTAIDVKSEDTAMYKLILAKAKTIDLPSASGFINNPFYHIRMWLVDREIAKYESLKDKKVLSELRLKELVLEQDRSGDSALSKQISYYENKITRLEAEIAEIERTGK